jgi:hypothetical protein
MKTIKLTLISFITFILICPAFAANPRFSIGLNGALPVGSYSDYAAFGVGGSARFELPLGDYLGLTITGTFLGFGKKTREEQGLMNYDYTQSLIPVQAGLKYYFAGQQTGFYINGEAGVSFLSLQIFRGAKTVNLDGNSFDVPEYDNTESTSNFSWAAGIGYALDNWDLGLNFNGFTETVKFQQLVNNVFTDNNQDNTFNYLNLRIAYVFGDRE